jgi:hypothetical protein
MQLRRGVSYAPQAGGRGISFPRGARPVGTPPFRRHQLERLEGTHVTELARRPDPADVHDRDPGLVALVEAIHDEDRVVVALYTDTGDGVTLDVGVRGAEGVLGFIALLHAIDGEIGADVDGVLMISVWPDLYSPAGPGDDPDAFPEWAFFGLKFQDPDGGSPDARLLHDLANTARAHREATARPQPIESRVPVRAAAAGPPHARPGNVAEDLWLLVAALTESDVVVLDARREETMATFFVATRGALGVRGLCESLERVLRRLGSGPGSIHLDAELWWEVSDRARLKMVDHPDWLTSRVQLYSIRRALRADELL